MAKDITEIINAAAVVRDETGEAANTAARVGGSIADVAQYIKEEIITPLLTAQSKAVSAERIAEYAKKIAEEAAGKITASLNKNDEQDTRISTNAKRILNYVYPKLYQLNEGAGAIEFHGFTVDSGALKLLLKKDTYQYRVLYSTRQKQFVLRVIDTANIANPTVGTFAIWDKIDLPDGSSIASSPSYAQRNRLYYIFEPNEGSTYYYIHDNGEATEQSATYLLRRLVDKNAAEIAKLQGNVVGPGGDITEHVEQIKELGEFDTFEALLVQAAEFDIVSNNSIALLHGTYMQSDSIYNGVLILQQVEKNSDGGGTAMQYIYSKKRQFTRSITFSATDVTSVQLPQNDGARNLSLSGRVLQMTNMWGDKVGDSATLPDNGNLYEGTAGASSVPITIAKTFGGYATATLGAATSARAGVMTVDHVNKISKLNDRILNYVYPKLYQINEGSGARVFHGFTEVEGSGTIETTQETYQYSVLYSTTQKQFVLNVTDEASETVGTFASWPKITLPDDRRIASSESYAQRNCLYYIFEPNEGSTYYYIDSNGVATEQSATYLLRRLVDKNTAAIDTLKGNDSAQNEEIAALGEKIKELGANIHDKGNLYEGTADKWSVPVVLAKTFGGTATATLGAATSARAGVMTIDHVNRISKLKERVEQYLYPKIYQLNEGAGAIPFDGIYDGNASVSTDRKEAVEEGCTYKVVFKLGSFYLQEISPGGTTVCLYSAWGKIISGRGSSEDYTRRDCLYYVYTEGEGSYYYYVDADGEISEQAGTYLLRRLIDETKAKIASVESTANSAQAAASAAQATATAAQEKNAAQDARLKAIEDSVSHLSAAGRYWNEANGTPTAVGHYGSLYALRSLPEKLGLGRYLVKDDRTRRKLDPKYSTKYADDGTPAALDGSQGQCMWCWNGFYANIWHEGSRLIKAVTFDRPVGNDISIWIPAGGISWLGAGVMDRTEMKLCSLISDKTQYIGGAGNKVDTTNCPNHPADTTQQITMLGMPATMMSTTEFGEAARLRGPGWEANWFVARFVVEFLFEVIMGTENSQEAFNANKDANGLYQGGFGTGVTELSNWNSYNGGYPVIPTSVGLEAGDGVCLVDYNLPNASGGTYKTFKVPVFFGLVGAGFGNLFQFVRGLIIDVGNEQSKVYVAPSIATYDPKTVDDKIMVAECPRVSGYITRKSYRGLCCMPTALGGSQNIRYSDYFVTNVVSKEPRVRAAGGHTYPAMYAGASYTFIQKKDSDNDVNFTAPLCYFTEDPIIPLSQSIANN